MNIRDRIRDRVSPLLPEGEAHVAAFPAGSGPIAGLTFRYRVVAVTDRGVHLFSARPWRVGDPKRLLASLPPGTVIGATRPSFLYSRIDLAGERLWVTRAFRSLMDEAIEASRAHRPPAAS